MSESVVPQSVESLWLELIAETEPKHKLMLPESALRLYYGRSARGFPQFFIRCKKRPSVPEVSSSIEATVAKRQDGEWALRFELVDLDFTHAFMSLAWNLAQASSAPATEDEGLSIFLSELAAWKRLLTFRPSDRRGLGEIRGLYAELWFGLEVLAHSVPLGIVLDSWGGPMGAPRDYAAPLPVAYEVKSVYPETGSIRISSAEQLDCDGPLELIVVRLIEVPIELANGESLPKIIGRYIDALGPDAKRRERFVEIFEKKLRVDVEDDYYNQFRFFVQGFKRFNVNDDFPVIRRSELASQIGAVDYSLTLAGLNQFEVEGASFQLHIEKDISVDS
ncbi:PD-(D/E)XK motif protein [Arthrobacter sp. FW305-BF8]|uniref:PD-(D/E)XK motif protein n=1 Tax=Arthrobacter sp. FW305-BF8 TaxID=2879617 RepID=UPI001F37E8AB|nr:PD-(D/E)XK motif protein [Arthrobacter sp. FW305-BF8]UKA55495.1 PD-(D/E)XK motif protein [Arthrobacter sp. FW305-BF8]